MSAGAINRPMTTRPGMASTMVNRPLTRTVTGTNWNKTNWNNWAWHHHHRRFFPFFVGVGLGLGYDYGYNSCWAWDGVEWIYVCGYPYGPYGYYGYGY